MPIVPDTKDWTWVLQRPCPQCGYDARTVAVPDLPGLIEGNAAAWPGVLQREGASQRPDDATWSPVEYAAHVRDVYRLFTDRLELMLEQDDPQFASWDQDAAAAEQRYAEQDPLTVAAELVGAAHRAARAFAAVPPAQYSRTGRRSDGAQFTVLSLGQYLMHEPVHHLWDVTHP